MNIAALNVKIGADLSGFEAGMKRVNDGIQNVGKEFDRISAKMSGFRDLGRGMQDVGGSLTVGLTLPILALGAASIKTFGDIQSLKLGLEAVTGSSSEAEKQFQRLREVAKLPGLGLAEAVKGSINLQTIGFSAEKAEKSLQVFGNAVATVGKGRVEFERAIYGLQQLSNTEFPLGEDLNILRDAIPQITPLLIDAFGTARTEELREFGITSEQVVNAIISGLGKLPPVAGGIKNAFENLGDSINNSLATIGEDLNKAFDVTGKINKIADFVERLATAFTNLSTPVKNAIFIFAGLAAAIGPLLVAFGGILFAIPSIVAGFAIFKTAVASFIGVISAGALPVIAIIAVIGALGAAIYGIVKAADLFGIAFKRTFLEVKGFVNDAILSMLESIQGFGEKFNIDLGLKDAVANAKRFQSEIKTALDTTPLVTFKDAEDKMRSSVIDAFTATKEKLDEVGEGARKVTARLINLTNIPPIKNDFFDGILKSLAIADQKAIHFGKSFDIVGEKVKILKDGIIAAFNEGMGAASLTIKRLQNELDKVQFNALKAQPLIIPVEIKLANTDLNGMMAKISKEGFNKAIPVNLESSGLGALVEVQKQFDIATQKSLAFGGSFDLVGEKAYILQNAISSLLENGFSAGSGAVVALQSQMGTLAESFVDISQQVKQAASEIAFSFGEMLGAALSSGEGFKNLPNMILSTLGGLAIQVGKIAIATGMAISGIKAALKSLNPAVAIGAGIALVTIGSAIKGSLSRAASGSGGGGSDYYGGGSMGRTQAGEGIASQSTINSQYGFASTQNSELIARVSGRDLQFVLNQEAKKARRTG